jgi:hypothetical protein
MIGFMESVYKGLQCGEQSITSLAFAHKETPDNNRIDLSTQWVGSGGLGFLAAPRIVQRTLQIRIRFVHVRAFDTPQRQQKEI